MNGKFIENPLHMQHNKETSKAPTGTRTCDSNLQVAKRKAVIGNDYFHATEQVTVLKNLTFNFTLIFTTYAIFYMTYISDFKVSKQYDVNSRNRQSQ
jgi:hypothetical protein